MTGEYDDDEYDDDYYLSVSFDEINDEIEALDLSHLIMTDRNSHNGYVTFNFYAPYILDDTSAAGEFVGKLMFDEVEEDFPQRARAVARYINLMGAEITQEKIEHIWDAWEDPNVYFSRTASWVLRNKTTKEVIKETFEQAEVDNLNTDKYEAVPIHEYLASLNIRDDYKIDSDEAAHAAEFVRDYITKGDAKLLFEMMAARSSTDDLYAYKLAQWFLKEDGSTLLLRDQLAWRFKPLFDERVYDNRQNNDWHDAWTGLDSAKLALRQSLAAPSL